MSRALISRRGLIAAAGAAALAAPARQASAQIPGLLPVDSRYASNVLIMGYRYSGELDLGPLDGINAATALAAKFLEVKHARRRDRLFSMNVFVHHNGDKDDVPTGANWVDGFKDFLGKPLEGTNVVLVYIGHGFVGARGVNMLLPDAPDDKTGTPLQDLMSQIGERKPHARIGFFNACRTGGDAPAEMPGDNVAVIYSSAGSQPSHTSAGEDLLETAFLRSLAKNISGQDELTRLFVRISNDLRNDKDRPVLQTNISDDVFLAGQKPRNGIGSDFPLYFPG